MVSSVHINLHIQSVKNNVYNVSGMIEEVKTNMFFIWQNFGLCTVLPLDGLMARLHGASFGATCSLRLGARRSIHPCMHQPCARYKAHVVAGAPQLQWDSSCNLSNRHIGLVTQLDVFRILYFNSAIIPISKWHVKFITV